MLWSAEAREDCLKPEWGGSGRVKARGVRVFKPFPSGWLYFDQPWCLGLDGALLTTELPQSSLSKPLSQGS